MKHKRVQHSTIIEKFRSNHEDFDIMEANRNNYKSLQEMKKADDEDVAVVFGEIVGVKRKYDLNSKQEGTAKKRGQGSSKDLEHFIPYQSADKHTEDAFIVNSFDRQAQNAEFSISDKQHSVKFKQGMKKWDRIKKKMVLVQDPRIGKIRTESGLWIPATYKTGRYKEWREKSKIEEHYREDDDNEAPLSHEQRYPIGRHDRHQAKLDAKKRMGIDSELKNSEQIVKKRLRVDTAKKRERENKLKKRRKSEKTYVQHETKGKKVNYSRQQASLRFA